ncbi:MAG: NAD(P)/FAD-dependent oxidoreductase, partial [Pseudomonadota bacterium]
MTDGPQRLDALIIGAGFAGLYQLHLLRDRLGLNARVLEAGDGVGGTWHWNRYPGARCDTESHAYCFTFSEELHRSWSWSERYPGQEEIRAYLNHAADFLDLRRDIALDARVVSAVWDEAARLWTVRTEAGEAFQARWLITAVGCLSTANMPDIEGRESFAGETHHTGRWPHEGVDFAGKRVGQIGTGSTGIQSIPVIARTAEHLTVFQRTANYSVPARNGPLSEDFKAWARDNLSEIRELTQSTPNGHPFRIRPDKVFDVSDEARLAAYEQAWETGGLRFRGVFQDLVADETANATACDFLKAKIRQIVRDPATAEALSDIDHPYGGKRPPIDTNYFETFNRPNVTLVNLRDTPIERIAPEGVVTSGGLHELDVLVFATGFDAMTGPLLSLGIEAGGRTLKDAWAEGPSTYLGLQIPGFPNLLTITGPGSPSVLTNMPVAIEQHAEWIADALAALDAKGETRIEASPEAAAAWGAHVQEAGAATLLPR